MSEQAAEQAVYPQPSRKLPRICTPRITCSQCGAAITEDGCWSCYCRVSHAIYWGSYAVILIGLLVRSVVVNW